MRHMPATPAVHGRTPLIAGAEPTTIAGALAAVCALVLGLTGCTGGSQAHPDLAGLSGPELLEVTADEMAGLETVRLVMTVDSELADLPLTRMEAQVTRDGDAAGAASIEQFGQLLEADFVVVGDDFHFRLLGGWQRLSRGDAAALALDPAVIFDPDRGMPAILRTATDPEITATPDTSAVGMYEVAVAVNADLGRALVPGLPDGLTATLFIDPQRPLLRQVIFHLPEAAGAVRVELSDFDADADIRAP
jgi:lipoprotein LprG